MKGPCMCGDPYCPRCGNPNREETDEPIPPDECVSCRRRFPGQRLTLCPECEEDHRRTAERAVAMFGTDEEIPF